MNIYVGNLSYNATEESLREAFEAHGTVISATIVKDKFSGKSRGFGFVEMADDSEAKAAINELNGKDLGGRSLTVNEARPRTNDRGNDRGPRRNGGGGGGFGGGGRF
jgi:RNA recognition motif-containing protein